jgi:RimJ/RimL family protein N-acetyltransferase
LQGTNASLEKADTDRGPSSNEALGRSSASAEIYDDPFAPGWGIEIGYHFDQSAWGNGYATELVRFCLQIARSQHSVRELQGFVTLRPEEFSNARVSNNSNL